MPPSSACAVISKVAYVAGALASLAVILFVSGCTERTSPRDGLESKNVLASAKNLDFEAACPDEASGACSWHVSYNARSDISLVQGESGQALEIDVDNGVGFIEQAVPIGQPHDEGILTFSALIKTDSVTGNGAGLNLGVYNADSLLIDSIDMGYGNFSSATGTSPWKRYSLEAVLTSDAARVHLGLINYGSGRAVFDSALVGWQPLQGRRASRFARNYIDVAIDHVRHSSLRRDSVDVDMIRDKALTIAGDAKTAEAMYTAIRFILGQLEDHHSFLMTAKERAAWLGEAPDGDGAERSEGTGRAGSDVTFSEAEKIGGYGLVTVPGFHSNDAKSKIAFADTLQQQLRRLGADNVQGWIVDLRPNDGGNMAPMLAGLEPLFSSDTLGFLIDVDGEPEPWGRGEAFRDTEGDEYVQPTATIELERRLPIAVLYGPQTGSSGEIVILSFVGNNQTQSFGQPSMGLTTGNGEFELPDGSYMYMASTRMADRSGRIYLGPVSPDVLVASASSATTQTQPTGDAVVDAAIRWLNTQRYR